MKNYKSIFICLTAVALVTGCTTSKDALIPPSDKNMRQVYSEHMGKGVNGNAADERMAFRRPLIEDEVSLAEYLLTEANQLSSAFPFIPNPVLVMYVAPHLATNSEVPIPGYVTQFRMYEKDNYALPHEVITYRGKE